MKRLFSCLLLLALFCIASAQIVESIKWTASVQEGEKVLELVFAAKIEPGFHVYDQTVLEDGPQATALHIERCEGLIPHSGLMSVQQGDCISHEDASFGMVLSYYEKEVVFVKKFDINDKQWSLEGYLTYMTCNDEMCTPPSNFEFSFGPSASAFRFRLCELP